MTSRVSTSRTTTTPDIRSCVASPSSRLQSEQTIGSASMLRLATTPKRTFASAVKSLHAVYDIFSREEGKLLGSNTKAHVRSNNSQRHCWSPTLGRKRALMRREGCGRGTATPSGSPCPRHSTGRSRGPWHSLCMCICVCAPNEQSQRTYTPQSGKIVQVMSLNNASINGGIHCAHATSPSTAAGTHLLRYRLRCLAAGRRLPWLRWSGDAAASAASWHRRATSDQGRRPADTHQQGP